jgi:hypothetical protein
MSNNESSNTPIVDVILHEQQQDNEAEEVEEQYCSVCNCLHPMSNFQQNHLLNDDVHKYNSVFVIQFEPQENAVVCDIVYQCIDNIYNLQQEGTSEATIQETLTEPRGSIELRDTSIDLQDGDLPADVTKENIMAVIEETTKKIEEDTNNLSHSIHRPTLFSVIGDISKILIALLLVLAFIFVGAVPIWRIEGRNEQKVFREYNITDTDPMWTYPNSIYFTVTTVLTIGFGDMFPVTRPGKIYIIFFAFFALSCVGFLVASIGEIFMKTISNLSFMLLLGIKRSLGYLFMLVFRKDLTSEELDPTKLLDSKLDPFERQFHKLLNGGIMQITMIIIVIIVYIVIGASIIRKLEDWTYLDAFYFTTIMMTTIGYGDVTPKSKGGRIFYCFFAVLGLGLLAILFGFVGQAIFTRIKDRVDTIHKKTLLRVKNIEKDLAIVRVQKIMDEVSCYHNTLIDLLTSL